MTSLRLNTSQVLALAVFTMLTSSAPAEAQMNEVSGRVVEKTGDQKGLQGVQVRFRDRGRELVPSPAVTDPSGRYTKPNIERNITTFTVEYSLKGYVADARQSVENNVYRKELDTFALAPIAPASKSEPEMKAALEALVRFTTVSGSPREAQDTLNTLRTLNPALLQSVLSTNPSIRVSLQTSGVQP